MGRFSPRPHDLRPYMHGGPNAFTGGFLSGLSTVTGIKDRNRRTDIAADAEESLSAYRETLKSEIEQRLEQNRQDRAREWDFRPEAPVVAEGPSTGMTAEGVPPDMAIPNVSDMDRAPDVRAPKPGTETGMLMEYDPSQKQPITPSEAEGPSSELPEMDPRIPTIQGTDIPGDRFTRVDVPGGSMLEQPRSYHQKKEALEGAHEELGYGPSPGLSSALAQGVRPFESRSRSKTPEEEYDLWERKEEYKTKFGKPDATTRNQEFKQRENQSEALAAAFIGEGLDMMEALDRAHRETGVYPDAALVQRTVDANYNRLMQIYRYIGVPDTDAHAEVIRNIAIRGMSAASALAPYVQAVDNAEFQDPKTGEWRVFTADDLTSIQAYIDKYGSVDNRAQGIFGYIEPVGFERDTTP